MVGVEQKRFHKADGEHTQHPQGHNQPGLILAEQESPGQGNENFRRQHQGQHKPRNAQGHQHIQPGVVGVGNVLADVFPELAGAEELQLPALAEGRQDLFPGFRPAVQGSGVLLQRALVGDTVGDDPLVVEPEFYALGLHLPDQPPVVGFIQGIGGEKQGDCRQNAHQAPEHALFHAALAQGQEEHSHRKGADHQKNGPGVGQADEEKLHQGEKQQSRLLPGFLCQEASGDAEGEPHKEDHGEDNGVPQGVHPGTGPVYIRLHSRRDQVQQQKKGPEAHPPADQKGQDSGTLQPGAPFLVPAQSGVGQQHQIAAEEEPHIFLGLPKEGMEVLCDHDPADQADAVDQVPLGGAGEGAAEGQGQKDGSGRDLDAGGHGEDPAVHIHAHHQVEVRAESAEHGEGKAELFPALRGYGS